MFEIARPAADHDSRLVDVRIRFGEFLRWTIESEWSGLSGRLASQDGADFREYYRHQLAHAFGPARDRYVRALWAGEVGWVARWLATRAGVSGRPPRVLDAGTGFGTFAMLFASLGADVVGIDLREDRVRVAETRLAAMRAGTGRMLPVRMKLASVTEPLGGPFDLIWSYNALSHIEPPADFLVQARASLAPDGVLVVADINGSHPGHRRRLGALRSAVQRSWIDSRGAARPYAVERTFGPLELRQLVEHTGLHVIHHEVFYLSPARLPERISEQFIRPLQRFVRAGSWFARRQFLVAAVAPPGAPHPSTRTRGLPA